MDLIKTLMSCTYLKQLIFRELEVKFFSVKEMVLQDIAERTGCLAPCTYTEYRLKSDTLTLVRFFI